MKPKFRATLSQIILLSTVCLLLLSGISLYFVNLKPLNDFIERNISNHLTQISASIYEIPDRAVDDLDREGLAGDDKLTKVSQLGVFMALEDVARQNNLRLIIDISGQPNTELLIRTDESIAKKALTTKLHKDGKFSTSDGETYYYRQFTFVPWGWRVILLEDESAYEELVRNVRSIFLATGALLLFIAILFTAYWVRSIVRPITKIVRQIREVTVPDYKGIKDFEFLSDNIGRMMKELQFRSLQLEKRVQERTKELEAEKRRAERADDAKSRFLRNVSHDFRTPLSQIKSYTDLVLNAAKDRLPERQYTNLENIASSTARLEALIRHIIDYSRNEEIVAVDIALEPMLDEILAAATASCRDRPVRLVKDYAPNLPDLYTDETKLYRILTNLVDNAVRFTEEGCVRLGARKTDGGIEITVEDSGKGISKSRLTAIFDEFKQFEEPIVASNTSVGLGLAIARRFTYLLGGHIDVRSQVGVGTVFRLTLPLRYQPRPYRQDRDETLANQAIKSN